MANGDVCLPTNSIVRRFVGKFIPTDARFGAYVWVGRDILPVLDQYIKETHDFVSYGSEWFSEPPVDPLNNWEPVNRFVGMPYARIDTYYKCRPKRDLFRRDGGGTSSHSGFKRTRRTLEAMLAEDGTRSKVPSWFAKANHIPTKFVREKFSKMNNLEKTVSNLIRITYHIYYVRRQTLNTPVTGFGKRSGSRQLEFDGMSRLLQALTIENMFSAASRLYQRLKSFV